MCDEMKVHDCGCIVFGAAQFCRTHAAAHDLLNACKAALKRWGHFSYGEVKMLADAIVKAEGKEVTHE